MKQEPKTKFAKLKIPFKTSLFARCFTLFAAILSAVIIILGAALVIILNRYYISNQRAQLKADVISIADEVEQKLTMDDINSEYSIEKEMICKVMSIICESTDADIFVCDTEGHVILCKECAENESTDGTFSMCDRHCSLIIDSDTMSSIKAESEIKQNINIM